MDRGKLYAILFREGLDSAACGRVADAVFATQPFKCAEGHVVEGHPTAEGYCCACDYDIAVMEGRLKQMRIDQRGEVVKAKLQGARTEHAQATRMGREMELGGHDYMAIDLRWWTDRLKLIASDIYPPLTLDDERTGRETN